MAPEIHMSNESVNKDWKVLEFYMPIEENFSDAEDFFIRGVAINETTTLNNVKYVAEELEKAAVTFRNVPILLDHKNEIRNIVGRTTERVNFNSSRKRIDFEGKIMDKEIIEMIKDGRIGSVSIGAKVNDLTEEEDGSMKAIGIRGLEISLVAVPGDSQATLAQAIEKGLVLKEMAQLNQKEDTNMAEEEKTPQEVPEEKPAEVPAEPEKAVEEPKAEEPAVVEPEKPEVVAPVAAPVEATAEMVAMKTQLSEIKSLLIEKKKVLEQAEEPKEETKEEEEKVDNTKGEVSVKAEEDLKNIDNRIVEALGKGNFALYRDYSKEDTDSNLKRLVR